MGQDDLTKKHVIYGSAGMAAAGMIPTAKSKRPEDEVPDEPAEPVEEPELEPEIAEGEGSESAGDIGEESGEIADQPGEDAPEPEIVEFAGRKAVVIEHAGAGNFGHNLDTIFSRLEGVRLDAVAEGNPEAVEEAQTRTGAKNAYADYREMLDQEQPDLVAVAPRWTDQRYEMIKAALEAGAHVCCERPFARTLKEADELLELAKVENLKIAVMHQMRCDPHLEEFHDKHEELIGDLLEMRVLGMMDDRAGGEDLLVLGTHLFDIVRWFGGEVSFCTARIEKDGNTALAEDSHESEQENLGRLLGDSIHAQFALDSGVQVSYVSDRRLREVSGPWGIEFVGSTGRMRLFAGMPPTLSLLVESDPESPDRTDKWVRWPDVSDDDYHAPVDKMSGLDAANRHVVTDWLAAIEEDRDPKCSGESAMKSLEMIHGVWQAGVTMKRAYFPLVNRLHPLNEEEE
ncbi:MAG: Gfo/Idh/MocA family oxidoreductase [Verrucomicrobiales bacterium]